MQVDRAAVRFLGSNTGVSISFIIMSRKRLFYGISLACIPASGLLLRQSRIRESEVDLTRSIASLLSAEGALDHDVVFGEGFLTGRDEAGTPLAGDDVVCRLHLPLLAVRHSHAVSIAKERRKRAAQ